jgi:hypothetical protein
MKINVTLGAANFAAHNEIITVPEEKVEIAFSSPIYPLDSLIITARKGAEIKQYRLTDGAVDITELCKSAGLIEMTAILEARGHAAKVWQIEPLVIKELDGGFAVIPELVAMRQDIETIKKALVEITKE